MRDVAAYDVGSLDVVFHRFKAGFDFGNHAAFYDALLGEVFYFAGVDRGDKGLRVAGVFHKAGNVGKEDELFRGKAAGNLGSGDIGVDIIGVAFLVAAYGGDDRNGAVHDRFEDTSRIDPSYLADVAPVERFAVFVRAFKLVDADGVGVLGDQGFRRAAELYESLYELGVDNVCENVFNDFHGFFVGDA